MEEQVKALVERLKREKRSMVLHFVPKTEECPQDICGLQYGSDFNIEEEVKSLSREVVCLALKEFISDIVYNAFDINQEEVKNITPEKLKELDHILRKDRRVITLYNIPPKDDSDSQYGAIDWGSINNEDVTLFNSFTKEEQLGATIVFTTEVINNALQWSPNA